MRFPSPLLALVCLSVAAPVGAWAAQPGRAAPGGADTFQAAYAAYQSGQMAAAATQLERLQLRTPQNFQVHELLGLTYAAQHQDAKALGQLQTAVKLQPRSLMARNNLATELAQMGDLPAASAAWNAALAISPADYTANRSLAKLALRTNDVAAALPHLQAAYQAQPAAADNTYDLALADLLTGAVTQARVLATQLLAQRDAGEYHTLLGRIDEREQQYVDAANEFATAARLDPSEDNLFVWASELMAHRAYVPAIAVFQQGTQRFPGSPRLWVGQGMALYSRGEYEPAIQALLTATDLNAEDPRAYRFLSKAYLSAPSQADQVIERFRRYAALQPNNAQAQFYYAVSLWKGRRADAAAVDTSAVEALLLRSLALDDTDAETHLQLGILYNDERAYDKAQPQFLRATQLDPDLADAHFRLGRAYLRSGDKAKSDAEFERFKQLQAQHQAQLDKERAEVQQFVIAANPPVAPAPAGSPSPPSQPTTQP